MTIEQLPFDPAEFGESPFEDAAAIAFDGLSRRPEYAEYPPLNLREVHITRMLGFEDTRIVLNPFNVLVGANNSGKSSLLRVVRFAYSLLRLHVDRVDADVVHLAQGRNLEDSSLPVAEVRDLWNNGVRRVGNDWVYATVELVLEDGPTIKFGLKSPFGHATSRVLSDREIPRDIYDRLVARPFVYIPYSVGAVIHEEYRTPVRVDALVAGGHVHEVIRNVLLVMQQTGSMDDLREILSHFAFEGDLGAVSFDETLDQFISVAYKGGVNHDLFNVGAGFLQVLQVLAFIVHQRPGVALVDEPDAHLHSSLQRTLIDILRRTSTELGVQVLVATHSKEIVNYVDPQDLVVVDRSAAHIEGLAPHQSAIAILEGLGSIDSVDAYQVITSRRVLLVEGKTDPKLLHGFAAKRALGVFEGDSRIVAVVTDGDSTPMARSDLRVLEEMLGSEVKSLQLRDRDARTEDHIAAIEGSVRRPLRIWRRDCIESYLLVPSAIARIVASEAQLKLDDVLPRVDELRDECLVALGDETFDRVATRWRTETQRLEDRYVEVAEANQVARTLLADEDFRLRATSGKSLLAALRLEIQRIWGVSFGNQRLLDEIAEDEVDPEIWEVLDAVTGLADSA